MWRWAVVGVVAAAVGAGAFLVLTRGDGPGDVPGSRPDAERGAAEARAACAAMSSVESLVRANASAHDVFDAVDRAASAAKDAAVHDIRWLPLSSGIEAVAEGLRRDNGRAADVGIRTTRANCEAVSPR